MTKSFKDCPNKRAVEHSILGLIKGKSKYIGIAGHDGVLALQKVLISHGIKEHYLYEISSEAILQILTDRQYIGKYLQLIQSDVINAPVDDEFIVDCDFCGFVESYIPHIQRFTRPNTCFTFSHTRREGQGVMGSIDTFFGARGEKYNNVILPVNQWKWNLKKEFQAIKLKSTVIKTGEARDYIIYWYKDGRPATNMLVFYHSKSS